MTRRMVARLEGQASTGPRAVFAQSKARMRSPISPPTERYSSGGSGARGGWEEGGWDERSSMRWRPLAGAWT